MYGFIALYNGQMTIHFVSKYIFRNQKFPDLATSASITITSRAVRGLEEGEEKRQENNKSCYSSLVSEYF